MSDAGVTRRVCIDHVTLRVADMDRSRDFYARALEPLGGRAVELPSGEVAFGPSGAEDLVLAEGGPARPPVHVAFAAGTREQVEEFHVAALAAGGRDNGSPGLRPRYHAGYFAAYVLDPDGNNVEAVVDER